jgi:hypothetical protein
MPISLEQLAQMQTTRVEELRREEEELKAATVWLMAESMALIELCSRAPWRRHYSESK